MTTKILLTPEVTGYSASIDYGVADRGVEGPALRMRKAQYNDPFVVGVEWQVSGTDYETLRGIYRDAELNGNPPYLIDLIIDGVMSEYIIKLSQDGMQVVDVSGSTFTIRASLYAISAIGQSSLTVYP